MLPPRLIKESSHVIAGPATKILKTAIVQGRYPSRWTMGQVTPVFKKADDTDKLNYWPVTVVLHLVARILSGVIFGLYLSI